MGVYYLIVSNRMLQVTRAWEFFENISVVQNKTQTVVMNNSRHIFLCKPKLFNREISVLKRRECVV